MVVKWIRRDATRTVLPGEYEAAICFCEGSVGLLSEVGDLVGRPPAILGAISRSLKSGAKARLTALNRAAMIRRSTDDGVRSGRFDPLVMVESSALSPREGLSTISVRERSCVPAEVVLICRLAGLSVVNLWDGTAGNWGRRLSEPDEIEIGVVAGKAAEPSADRAGAPEQGRGM